MRPSLQMFYVRRGPSWRVEEKGLAWTELEND